MTTTAAEKRTTFSDRVAEEIRVMMTRRRVSGRQLSRQLEVSPSWVSYRLSGVQPIDLNDLERIAIALEVTVADLLPRGSRPEVTAYSTTPAAPHAVDVRSPRSRARSRFAQAAAA